MWKIYKNKKVQETLCACLFGDSSRNHNSASPLFLFVWRTAIAVNRKNKPGWIAGLMPAPIWPPYPNFDKNNNMLHFIILEKVNIQKTLFYFHDPNFVVLKLRMAIKHMINTYLIGRHQYANDYVSICLITNTVFPNCITRHIKINHVCSWKIDFYTKRDLNKLTLNTGFYIRNHTVALKIIFIINIAKFCYIQIQIENQLFYLEHEWSKSPIIFTFADNSYIWVNEISFAWNDSRAKRSFAWNLEACFLRCNDTLENILLLWTV